MIPEFAIMGHPNEGKSSVLSTLSEDDSVRISPEPGETLRCRTFPVIIDNKEIIRFTDTPGFQNPGRLLSELKKFVNASNNPLEKFHQQFHSNKDLQHDCELLLPLLRGAGIIYVADGSRPLRNVDLAEMEILRLTGKPRMAILNCKGDEHDNIDQWKEEFRKHFNSSRVFNAHRATYRERINLLEALQSIEQDWQEPLSYVVTTFKADWQTRNNNSADIICELIGDCVRLNLQTTIGQGALLAPAKEKLFRRYTGKIKKLEHQHHSRIKKLYKHNIFDYQMPAQSVLHQDLFAATTWEFLGLSRRQLAAAGGAGGAALAAGLDIAAGGTSLGLFTSIGGALGALGALYGSKNIATKIKVFGLETGRIRLQVGPNKNPQFPYILLDRVLLYYSHIINWAHGRRDYNTIPAKKYAQGLIRKLPGASLKKISRYVDALRKEGNNLDNLERECKEVIIHLLNAISNTEEYEDNTYQ